VRFQDRYLAHQKRKAKVLSEIIAERHSDRRFGPEDIDIAPILKTIDRAPSSCDRKAIVVTDIIDRDSKALLSGLLVGGVGWVHRANHILLLFADASAYLAKGEIDYMPYLDAGVVVGQIYLTATAHDYACCFVNPNIREENKEFFIDRFGLANVTTYGIFCGAIALGSKINP
jgi:nitroreductase